MLNEKLTIIYPHISLARTSHEREGHHFLNMLTSTRETVPRTNAHNAMLRNRRSVQK